MKERDTLKKNNRNEYIDTDTSLLIGSTQIGSQVTKSFTVVVPSGVVPKIKDDAITLTPQTYNYLIHGKNKIKVFIVDLLESNEPLMFRTYS